jgi:predicted  nucleic acid-binding Zn-ribbon protein
MHKCIRCGAVYQDNDSSILRGCSGCGSIFFLFLKTPQDAVEVKEIEKELESRDTTLEKELIKKIEEKKKEEKIPKEKEIPEKKAEKKREMKIEFGIETVRIPREGIYEINLDALMKKRPLIILEKEKVYFIHLPSVFEIEE